MSEKLLAGACDNCPLRDKIDCDTAELMRLKQNIQEDPARLGDIPAFHPVSYEFSDNPNNLDAYRYEIRPDDAHDYVVAAKQAANENANGMTTDNARATSYKSSLGEALADCDGPTGEAAFWRRKKCGANILGRVVSGSIIEKRNQAATLLEEEGATGWMTPESLKTFKPIK